MATTFITHRKYNAILPLIDMSYSDSIRKTRRVSKSVCSSGEQPQPKLNRVGLTEKLNRSLCRLRRNRVSTISSVRSRWICHFDYDWRKNQRHIETWKLSVVEALQTMVKKQLGNKQKKINGRKPEGRR